MKIKPSLILLSFIVLFVQSTCNGMEIETKGYSIDDLPDEILGKILGHVLIQHPSLAAFDSSSQTDLVSTHIPWFKEATKKALFYAHMLNNTKHVRPFLTTSKKYYSNPSLIEHTMSGLLQTLANLNIKNDASVKETFNLMEIAFSLNTPCSIGWVFKKHNEQIPNLLKRGLPKKLKDKIMEEQKKHQ